MKKMLACGLVVSTLISFGSVCVLADAGEGYCQLIEEDLDMVVRFDWDIKGKSAHSFDSFVKDGNGKWVYIGSEPLFHDMIYTSSYNSAHDYKMEIFFDDGSISAIEFGGTDLEKNSDLDLGVACFKNIRIA